MNNENNQPLQIIERYNEQSALISIGHSYSVPSKVTKRHLRELLLEYDDDEILNLSQLEVPGQSRPILLWPVGQTEEPLKKCLCVSGV